MKEIFQSIIATMQREIPFKVLPRELSLPLHSAKIITVPGVRRCGKSSLLGVTANRLVEKEGVAKERILWIGFDDERLAGMNSSQLDAILEAYRDMFPDTDMADVYMFFDEIQLVDNWELFVMRVYKTCCKNIFISGSNAEMLSSQIASSLRGWPLEFKAYPLSFGEYLSFKHVQADLWTDEGRAKLRNAFRKYNHEGGFPDPTLAENESLRMMELQGYFNTMLFRDMIEHYHLTNPTLVRYFLKRVMGNLSKPTSVNNIYNEIRSQGGKISKDRLYDLLNYAESIFLLFKVSKYDNSLVKENASLGKYYIIDNGLRQSVLLPQSDDEGKLLENTVFLHLLRKSAPDTKLSYFKNGRECDFVVQRDERVEKLIQVTWALDDENKTRELEGLRDASVATGCKDMTIVTYDQQDETATQCGTVKVVPAWKWLLE